VRLFSSYGWHCRGAEATTLPEVPTNPEEVAQTLQLAYEHGKSMP
jgi:hypothetical protein